MNTKSILALIVVILFLLATARAPISGSSSTLDQAPLEERNSKMVDWAPGTGETPYDYEQEALAYPSQQLHSSCVSANNQRQALCQEKEPNFIPGSIYIFSNSNTDDHAYPSQKLHGACASQNIQRQESCVE